jgi:uncharacterized protein YcaQ
LPILFGDRLVGRIEPRGDRAARAVRVLGLWWESGFDPLAAPRFADALAEALDAHRRFLAMNRIVLPRAARHRALAAAVRERLGSLADTPPPRRQHRLAVGAAVAPAVRG